MVEELFKSQKQADKNNLFFKLSIKQNRLSSIKRKVNKDQLGLPYRINRNKITVQYKKLDHDWNFVHSCEDLDLQAVCTLYFSPQKGKRFGFDSFLNPSSL